jgi:hypothetical protein
MVEGKKVDIATGESSKWQGHLRPRRDREFEHRQGTVRVGGLN